MRTNVQLKFECLLYGENEFRLSTERSLAVIFPIICFFEALLAVRLWYPGDCQWFWVMVTVHERYNATDRLQPAAWWYPACWLESSWTSRPLASADGLFSAASGTALQWTSVGNPMTVTAPDPGPRDQLWMDILVEFSANTCAFSVVAEDSDSSFQITPQACVAYFWLESEPRNRDIGKVTVGMYITYLFVI